MPSKIKSSDVECREPVDDMGYNPEVRNKSRHLQTSRTAKEKILATRASQSLKLQSKLKSEKAVAQSYADTTRHDIIQNVEGRTSNPLKSYGNNQKQGIERKTTNKEELVKYMSNLPGYLQRVEKGENLQEKALNFGVLNWRHLEKWKYDKKQVPGRSSMNSESISNVSSLFSTVGSTTLSSRSTSASPSPQRKPSPSLRSYLNSSLKEGHSQGVKPFSGDAVNLQDFRTLPKNTLAGQVKLPREDHSYGRNHSEIKLDKGKNEDLDSEIATKTETLSSNLKDYKVLFCPKGATKARDTETKKRVEPVQELGFHRPDNHCHEKIKPIVLLLPGDRLQNSCSRAFQQSASTILDRKSTEANRKSFSDSYLKEEDHSAELCSDVPHSCPLPRRVGSSKQLSMKLPSSVDYQSTKVSSDAPRVLPHSDEIPTSQSKGKQAEANMSTIRCPTTKGRNPSPNHQSSVVLGRMSRSFTYNEGSVLLQLKSTNISAKSGPVKSEGSAISNNPNRDKDNATSRARSSPLRRLLDPLLKPKAVNCLHSTKPVQEESAPTRRACKSSDGRLGSTAQPVDRNLDFSSCSPSKANGSNQDGKHRASTVQALLQVMEKGLPLFTFAVDNESDVLAASTGKITTIGKDDGSYIYTFYSVHEIKKKIGGWITQRGKDKSRGYLSNIVGQMKVSSSHCSKLTKHNLEDLFAVREFVLFGVELRQADQGVDYIPSSELAATVVKVPKENRSSLGNDGHHCDKDKGLSEIGFTECSPKVRCSSKSEENLQNRPAVGNECLPSVVVILPSGVHSMASTGIPSPLIERWKSGGSCDCGGWDVSCKLRVLANQDQFGQKSSSSEVCPTPNRFDLFVQGGAQENRPIFSLVPFKKGIYSVAFNSSISTLQAFSICVSVLSSRRSDDLSDLSNPDETKTSEESVLVENDKRKAPTPVKGEAPTRYVPFPPLSPVGRV